MNKLLTKKFKNSRPGFTIIELLIVIAIIGLLSTLSIIALNSTRARARDARRMHDIRQITTALEMYYNDNGKYPECNGKDSNMGGGWYTCLQPALSPYLSPLPRDPKKEYFGYSYSSYGNVHNQSQFVMLGFIQERANPNLNNAYFGWYNGSYGYIYSTIISNVYY